MAVHAQIKIVQGLAVSDGRAAIVTKGVACTVSNSDGSGSTVDLVIEVLTGQGGAANQQSGTYSDGQSLITSGGASDTVDITMDFDGTMALILTVDKGLPTQVQDRKVISTLLPSHPDAVIIDLPFGADQQNLNFNGETEGYAYVADGWMNALSLASRGKFAVSGAPLDGVLDAVFAEHRGLGAAGVAVGFKMSAPNDLGGVVDAARLVGGLSDVAPGSEKGFMAFQVLSGGVLTERGRVDDTGLWTLPALTVSGTATLSGYVPTTRRIIAGTNVTITGGGGGSSDELTANLTVNASGGGGGGYATMTDNVTDQTARTKLKVDGTLLHFADDGSSHTVLTAPGYVPTTTHVDTSTGLSGGGALSGTLTLSLANTSVGAGSYTYAGFTVDAQGRLTAASSGAAPALAATTISAAGDLTGGGDLSTNRTITLPNTLTSKTFAESAAGTFPAIVNKTGSAQAANHLLDFQRGGGSKHHFELDVSDVLHLFSGSTDIASFAAASIGFAIPVTFTGTGSASVGGGTVQLTGTTAALRIDGNDGGTTNQLVIAHAGAGAAAPFVISQGSTTTVLLGYDASVRAKITASQYGDTLTLGGGMTYTAAAEGATYGSSTLLSMVAGANSNQTTGTSIPHVLFDIAATQTWTNSGGGVQIAEHGCFRITQPTLNFDTNTSTPSFTDAATLTLAGPPIAGGNAVITNPWTINILAGATRYATAISGSLGLYLTNTVAASTGTRTQGPPIVVFHGSGKISSTVYEQYWQVGAYAFGSGSADSDPLVRGGSWQVAYSADNSSYTTMLNINSGGIGLYGATPVARATTYTVHAGSLTRDLPATPTAQQVGDCLRQLLTDVGLIGITAAVS